MKGWPGVGQAQDVLKVDRPDHRPKPAWGQEGGVEAVLRDEPKLWGSSGAREGVTEPFLSRACVSGSVL